MKSYPSIPRSTGSSFREFDAYVFDKLDGSNLRFEWSRKAGWYKFGTRTRLFDGRDPDFGAALPIFALHFAEPLEALAREQRWEGLTVFAEFFGPRSFAGVHQPGDPKSLAVIDVAPHRGGILPPRDFLKLVAPRVATPAFLGQMRWTRGLVEQVRRGEVAGISFEGVVGKAAGKQGPIMAKAKTEAWLQQVRALYDPATAQRIIES